MKTFFITFFLFVASIIFNQSIGTDSLFGINGYYKSNELSPISPLSTLIQSDGKILVFGNRIINGNSQNFIFRLNTNGSLDTNFGINGIYSGYSGHNEGKLFFHNGKILVFYNISGIILRLNINGTTDNSFGLNGIINLQNNGYLGENILIDNLLYVTRHNALDIINVNTGTINTQTFSSLSSIAGVNRISANKLCLHSKNFTNFSSFLTILNLNGSIDSSFGNNGTITTNTFQSYNEVFRTIHRARFDSSNNIYYGIYDDNPNNFKLKKYNTQGVNDSSFGTNGEFIFQNFLFNDFNILEDKIYINGGNIGASVKLLISRLTLNGVFDNTFNNTGVFIDESNIFFYLPANFNITNINNSITFFVTGLYTENLQNGQAFVGKFKVNNLSNNNFLLNEICLENPVNNNLNFQSSIKVKNIELFSIDGKLIRYLSNNEQINDLSKGIYLVKFHLENETFVNKKIIKN